MKWVSYKFQMLNVVGYLILGFFIGPKMLNIVPQEFINGSHVIIDMSLALVSVLVGANLRYNVLRKVWKQIVTISIFEAIFTFLLIGMSFYMLFEFFDMGFSTNYRITIALIFGVLASATAPATILAVTHQLGIKNGFSSFLLGVVATDNAITLVLFSIVVVITRATADFTGHALASVWMILPILFFTILLGIIGAILSEGIDRIFQNHESVKTTSTLGMIFLVYGLSNYWDLDPLLASLVMGVVMSNLSSNFFLVKKEFDYHLQDIIYMLFFTLSAMHLNIEFILTMPMVVVSYVVFRILGKVLGVWVGGKVSGASKNIQNYMGIALFPQAGVAIGLALSLQSEVGFETIAPIVLNIIIATTMIHEFVGPILTKYALLKNSKRGQKSNNKT